MLKIETVIKAYLEKKNLSLSGFSRLVKIDAQCFYNWFKGISEMRSRSAEKIERYTKGDIRYEDLTTKPRKKKHLRGTQLTLDFSDSDQSLSN